MVTVTIERTGKLEKSMGIGEGRITEGRIAHDGWDSVQAVTAKTLGLRAITTVHLTIGTIHSMGTPAPCARVLSPGSLGNSVRIVGPGGSYNMNYIAVGV